MGRRGSIKVGDARAGTGAPVVSVVAGVRAVVGVEAAAVASELGGSVGGCMSVPRLDEDRTDGSMQYTGTRSRRDVQKRSVE